MREITEVHSGWRLDLARPAVGSPSHVPSVGATVPGCVHTDLMASGVLPDPYLDRNEEQQHWVGDSDWRYTTELVLGAGDTSDRVDLVFDGLDTVATVSLDGAVIGRTENMHRSYRFEVTESLTPGSHQLTVDLAAARAHAEQVKERVGTRPGAYEEPLQYIRKMACNFGWDWGPTLLTAGIWKDVRLERWSTGRLSCVRPEVRVDQSSGRVTVHVDVERAGRDAEQLRVVARIGSVTADVPIAADESTATLQLCVPDIELWWPHDMGEQPLYSLAVELSGSQGALLDTWSRRVGFRTVELNTTPDEHGTPFAFTVNGYEIFVRGVNWIPDDCFPSRITKNRLQERAQQAVDANVNLLRVWGGGLYETDDFYTTCDELGLLVWQDFPFACAAYPESDPLRDEVEAEARENVVRLMPHPSLVLWNGNNECIWGFYDWGWQKSLQGRSWGWDYYTVLLPAVVAALDPTRAYWPGSPYSGTPELHPNDPAHGNTHIWTVWNEQDYTDYRKWSPRFVSEFGFQGPPNWATLTRAVHDDPLLPESPGMLTHQKAVDGPGKLTRGMAAHLPAPQTTDHWHYLTQLNQARAISFGVEHFRSLQPLCRGAVLWQLNDCWPAMSWAAIDGDGRRKPAWYALRRGYAAQLLTVQPRFGEPAVIAVNNGNDEWAGVLEMTRESLSGEVLAKSSSTICVPPGETVTTVAPNDITRPVHPAGELIVARLGTDRALWFFTEDREMSLDPAPADVSVSQAAGGVEVQVRALSLIRDLVLQADRLDPSAQVDDQLLTLLAGDSHTFRVTTSIGADDSRWAQFPVLAMVNSVTAR